MGQPLYKERTQQGPGLDNVRPFGFAPVFALLLAFFAIHAHLAGRLPVVALEAELLGHGARAAAHGFDLGRALAGLFGGIFPEPFGSRLPFVLLSVATSLLVYRTVVCLGGTSIGGAVAIVWLNTTVAFGIGSALALPELLSGLGLSMVLLAVAEIANGRSSGFWAIAWIGLAVAGLGNAGAVWAAAGVCLYLLAEPGQRHHLIKPGFLVFLTTFGFFALQVSGAEQLVPSVSALAVGIGPGLLFFAAIGVLLATSKNRSAGLLLPAAMSVSLLIAAAAGAGAALIAAVPAAAVLATLTALGSKGFLRNWMAEITTPVAFLGYMLALYLIVTPSSPFIPSIPALNSQFGWPSMVARMENASVEARPKWILVDEAEIAARISAFSRLPVINSDAKDWRKVGCTASGLLVTASPMPDAIRGVYTNFRRLAKVDRTVGPHRIETFQIFEVSGPTAKAGCQN